MSTCKDCAAEWGGFPPPAAKQRPAPFPGPRCATHHRAVKKARSKAAHEKRVQAVYGLTPGQYEELYNFQGGLCYICQRANGKTRRLSVDHDHKTEKVRGLVCRPCNDVLGHFRDRPETFERGAEYLRRPPFDLMTSRV